MKVNRIVKHGELQSEFLCSVIGTHASTPLGTKVLIAHFLRLPRVPTRGGHCVGLRKHRCIRRPDTDAPPISRQFFGDFCASETPICIVPNVATSAQTFAQGLNARNRLKISARKMSAKTGSKISAPLGLLEVCSDYRDVIWFIHWHRCLQVLLRLLSSWSSVRTAVKNT